MSRSHHDPVRTSMTSTITTIGFSCDLFQLSFGDCLCVQGSNGSGKTTLLRHLAGLSHPTAALPIVRQWQGHPIIDPSAEFQSQMLWLGHRHGLDEATSIAEEWQFWQTLFGKNPYPLQEVAAIWALSRPLSTHIAVLSAGEKQKVALGRLLLGQHRLWILDEPDSHLDADSRQRLLQVIRNHCDDGGMVIVASHQPDIAAQANLQHRLN